MNRNMIQYVRRGVAQLVARLLWELEHQIGGSIPLTRKPVAALALFLLDFSPALV